MDRVQFDQRNQLLAILIIGGLFAIFGFVTWVNGALIPFMQSICDLSAAAAFLVATASYISFSVMALPSSWILGKVGYKNGMSLGLFAMALGALVFIPAADSRTYLLFLAGIFIQGAGMTLLQTAVNPYVTIMGPIDSAASRISIMGICNKTAGAVGSLIFGALLLDGIDEKNALLEQVSLVEKEMILGEMASSVVSPYMVMAFVLVVLGIGIRFAPLPEIDEPSEELNVESTSKRSIFQFPHLWLGVLTLFVYVGAEVIAGDSIIKYGISLGFDQAKFFTSFTLLAMIATYLLGVIMIPRYISQRKALALSAILGVLFSIFVLVTTGFASVMFVAALGFANALVWPAVWPLAIEGLGRFTKTGAALLIMGVSGGAVIPPLYGYLEDISKARLLAEGAGNAAQLAAQSSYWILIPCYLVILYFAISGYKLGTDKK